MRGIGMNIDIATRSYTGVVLSLLIRADGVSYYRISLRIYFIADIFYGGIHHFS